MMVGHKIGATLWTLEGILVAKADVERAVDNCGGCCATYREYNERAASKFTSCKFEIHVVVFV